ncbi:MAG: hypothetical protein L0Y76_04115, partial [Ignavibacteria bacterium]|nr:hypothetical protein [Ignavibacteria bacterium]
MKKKESEEKMRHKTLITTIIILGMFFVLGATNELQAYNEARVRYILCDISLGGSIGYYRDFPNNPNAREALRRWRKGVRVLNLDEFEREMDFGVVYAGTCDIIDGMDVDLTTDHECRQCNHRHYITPGVQCVFPHINIIGNFHHRGHRWWVPPPP